MQGENTPLDQKGKLAIELTSYDMSGLRNYFMKTKSWESTFRSFEFVTPTYVYNKADLANRPYTENGYHTQIPRLSVNIVFNFKTVIDHNPILKRDLAKFQLLKGETTRDYIIQERILFLVIILLTIVCFMAMRYTHKILSEE